MLFVGHYSFQQFRFNPIGRAGISVAFSIIAVASFQQFRFNPIGREFVSDLSPCKDFRSQIDA